MRLIILYKLDIRIFYEIRCVILMIYNLLTKVIIDYQE